MFLWNKEILFLIDAKKHTDKQYFSFITFLAVQSKHFAHHNGFTENHNTK